MLSTKRNFSSGNSVPTQFMFFCSDWRRTINTLQCWWDQFYKPFQWNYSRHFANVWKKNWNNRFSILFFLNIKSLVFDLFTSKSGNTTLKNRHLISSNVCYRCNTEFVIKLVRTRDFHSPLFHVFEHFLNCKTQTNMKRNNYSGVAINTIHRFPSLFSIFSKFPEFFVCNQHGNFNEKSMLIWLNCLDVFFEHWKKWFQFEMVFQIE